MHRLAHADLGDGETLVATTDFADVDTGLQADGLDVRCEILAVAKASEAELSQFLLGVVTRLETARVIPAQPGTLLPDVAPDRHALLIAPYVWGGPTPQVKEENRWTLALQAVALTNAEYAYAVEEGVAAFQQAVAEQGIDVRDFARFEQE